MKKKIASILVCLSATMFGVSTAYGDAFEGLSMMRMGAWEVDFSGNVNAFFTNGECDSSGNGETVYHGLACGSDGNDRDYGDVRDGLLPSWLNFSAATTTDNGIRTAIHLSFQPGTDTNSGFTEPLDGALGLSSVNFRQTFLTFGNDELGTFKIGRDLGVFGSDAILNDMTLLGVGSGAQGSGHTTLGRIGIGYLYADWKAQVQYQTPNFNGFTVTAAIVDPWGVSTWNGYGPPAPAGAAYSADDNDGRGQEQDTYGFEAKVNYNTEFDGGSLGLWVGYITQSIDFEGNLQNGCVNGTGAFTALRGYDAAGVATADCAGGDTIGFAGDDSADADGYDIGAKIVFGDFDVVAYYYDGEGIGTTSFLLDALDPTGEERDSDGYYLQARYRLPIGTLLGVSVGESNLEETALDQARLRADASYNLVETSESWIVGAYHPIGEALNLVVEYTNTEAEAHNGNEAEEDSIAIGAIMFF